MGIGDRLRAARIERGLKQKELAQMVGVKSPSAVSNWEKGLSMPDIDMCVRLCKALNIRLSYLAGYYGGSMKPAVSADSSMLARYDALDEPGRAAVDAIMEIEYRRCTASSVQPQSVRLINFYPLPVSAGTGLSLGDADPEPIPVLLTENSRRADFVLEVRGDSMEPRFHNGDLLLIQAEESVDTGDLAVVGVNGEAFFKRIQPGYLESLNAAYKPIRLSENDSVHVFGKVLGTAQRA